MVSIYKNRICALRKKLKERKLDGIFVTSLSNVRYLTGTNGYDISLWITQEEAVVMTDFRNRETAGELTWLTLFETDSKTGTIDFLRDRAETAVGVEKDAITVGKYLELKENLPGKMLLPVSGIFEQLRITKDEEELRRIAAAEQLGDEAFAYILDFLRPGISEIDIAAEINYFFRKHGASEGGCIAASGVNSARPHVVPSNRTLKTGDFLTIDMGCVLNGYWSDMTRTVAIGQPSEEMKAVYALVLKAQMTACENIHAGLTGAVCDSFARNIIEKAGYGACFGHSLGHGTGVDGHELPRFSQNYTETIPENAVVSIEPGIYLEKRFGVRIEDLVIVKKDGIVNLARSPRELMIL